MLDDRRNLLKPCLPRHYLESWGLRAQVDTLEGLGKERVPRKVEGVQTDEPNTSPVSAAAGKRGRCACPRVDLLYDTVAMVLEVGLNDKEAV